MDGKLPSLVAQDVMFVHEWLTGTSLTQWPGDACELHGRVATAMGWFWLFANSYFYFVRWCWADDFEGTAWKAGFTRQWLLMEIS